MESVFHVKQHGPRRTRDNAHCSYSVRPVRSAQLQFLPVIAAQKAENQTTATSSRWRRAHCPMRDALLFPKSRAKGSRTHLVPWIPNILSAKSLFYQVTSFPRLSLTDGLEVALSWLRREGEVYPPVSPFPWDPGHRSHQAGSPGKGLAESVSPFLLPARGVRFPPVLRVLALFPRTGKLSAIPAGSAVCMPFHPGEAGCSQARWFVAACDHFMGSPPSMWHPISLSVT